MQSSQNPKVHENVPYYNQATTKLAFHSNETSKDKLPIIYNRLSIIVIKVHAKLQKYRVHLYMLITLKHWKVVEKFVEKVYGEKHSFTELTYVVGAHWNWLNEAIPMCTNNICYWN